MKLFLYGLPEIESDDSTALITDEANFCYPFTRPCVAAWRMIWTAQLLFEVPMDISAAVSWLHESCCHTATAVVAILEPRKHTQKYYSQINLSYQSHNQSYPIR